MLPLNASPSAVNWKKITDAFGMLDRDAPNFDDTLKVASEALDAWPDTLRTCTIEALPGPSWLPLCRSVHYHAAGKSLPKAFIEQLQHIPITHLHLTGDTLKSIDGIENFKALQWFYVKNFHGSKWKPLKSISSLRGFSATECDGIGSLVDHIYKWKKLTQLTIARCALNGLPKNLGKMRALTHLDLSHNALDDISGIAGLTALTHLSIHGNVHENDYMDYTSFVTGFSDVFLELTSLEYLEMGHSSFWENEAHGFGNLKFKGTYATKDAIDKLRKAVQNEVLQKVARLRKTLDKIEQNPTFAEWRKIARGFESDFEMNYSLRYNQCME